MNSKNAIIGILALATISCGVYAWRQNQRASALDEQVASLTKAAAERVQRRATGPRSQPDGSTSQNATGATTETSGTQGPGRADWQNRMSNMRAVLESQEGARLAASQQRGMIATRYAGLFKALNLPPGQLARLQDLLIEKQNAARDVRSVALEQGMDMRNNRGDIQQLIQLANADIDAGIIAAIGEDKFAQYQFYEQTQVQRAFAGQVEQRLSYTSEPLAQAQIDQLVTLLAANTSAAPGGERGPRVFGGGGPPVGGMSQGVQITDQIIRNAQSFLSQSQVDVLRQMQAEQDDQRKLQQLISGQEGGGGRQRRVRGTR